MSIFRDVSYQRTHPYSGILDEALYQDVVHIDDTLVV